MNITTLNALIERSRSKKNGIYTYRGIYYRVHEGILWLYALPNGEIQEVVGVFSVGVATVPPEQRKAYLKRAVWRF